MRITSPLRSRITAALAIPIVVLTVAGCHRVSLSQQEEAVRVIRDASQVSRCRFVRDVESSDRITGGLVNRDKAEENAYKILKQKTAKLGANTVLVAAASSGYTGSAMKGKAYSCSAS